jgi:hypothetical protein
LADSIYNRPAPPKEQNLVIQKLNKPVPMKRATCAYLIYLNILGAVASK